MTLWPWPALEDHSRLAGIRRRCAGFDDHYRNAHHMLEDLDWCVGRMAELLKAQHAFDGSVPETAHRLQRAWDALLGPDR